MSTTLSPADIEPGQVVRFTAPSGEPRMGIVCGVEHDPTIANQLRSKLHVTVDGVELTISSDDVLSR